MNAALVRSGVDDLMSQYETEPEHVLHVRDLALQVFDGLQAWHQLSDEDRLILDAAASLHDIGWKVSGEDGRGHHKASARLIREFVWGDVSPEQVELMAQVARYHRKSTPSLEHEEFAALTSEQQRRVSILAAMLRIGDALDRRHRQFVRRASVVIKGGAVEIAAHSPREVETELEAAEKKGDLLVELFPGDVLFSWVAEES